MDKIIVTGYKSIKIQLNFENEKKHLKIVADNNN